MNPKTLPIGTFARGVVYVIINGAYIQDTGVPIGTFATGMTTR